MNLIEASIILTFVLLLYLQSPYKTNFVQDIPSSVRIHKSILMSLFLRHSRRSLKFWQQRKKWEVDWDSRLQEQSRLIAS